MFSDFPRPLLDKMGKENLALHAHTYVVATETYKKYPALDEFFQVTAVDFSNNTEFVMAAEARHYPIYVLMNHPETQNMRVFSPNKAALTGKVNSPVTDAINFYFSNLMMREASKNLETHSFVNREFGKRMSWLNAPVGFTIMSGGNVLTYGLP
jgi:hypothetical protein